MVKKAEVYYHRNNREFHPTIESFDHAKQMREIFYGSRSKKIKNHNFGWPRFFRYLGITNAENYFSDKKLAKGNWEPFKHIAEGPQYLFVNDENTRMINDNGQPIALRESKRKRGSDRFSKVPNEFFVKTFEVNPKFAMPKQLADLAPCLGIQWKDPSGKFLEVRIPNSFLAGARHPITEEVILVVYTDEGIHFIITGDELDITEDGIVG